MALLCPLTLAIPTSIQFENENGNAVMDTIRPLFIGDKVPDIKFKNIINYPSPSAKLSDFRGKLVILDFWGKYCAPCIHALAKLDSLQEQFMGQVQIITISDFLQKSDLEKTIGRIFKKENFHLPVLLEDKSLSQYFAHQIVSHLVWINKEGVVIAITGSDYVTTDNIQNTLDGKLVNLPVKRDVLGFDYRKPLLAFAQPNTAKPKFLLYSTLTANIDGIAPPSGTFEDTAKNVSITSFYNQDLLSLCQIAIDYKTGATPDDFILNVKNTSRYIKPETEHYDQWEKNNTYCYYIQLPLHTSESEIIKTVKQDLLHWLSVLGIEARKDRYKNADVYIVEEKELK